MKEFTIILPVADTEQNRVAHKHLRSRLITWGGGYSASFISGAWRAPSGEVIEDEGWRYTCAVDPAKVTDVAIEELAHFVMDVSGESALYVIHTDGEVVIY